MHTIRREAFTMKTRNDFENQVARYQVPHRIEFLFVCTYTIGVNKFNIIKIDHGAKITLTHINT